MKKLFIWLLAIGNYLAIFGVPIVVSYLLFAEQIEAKIGGAFWYFVLLVLFVLFVKKINAAIKKQKAGYTKAIFKLLVSLITLYVVYQATLYIEVNFDKLAELIIYAIAGRMLGFALELWAVKIDKVFVESIGVI
jgi:predicted Na+-dependent transporter